MLQVLKFFQLLNVLFQEHQAEADEEQQAGKPDGPAAHGGQCKAAEAGTQREQEDDGEVVKRLAEGFGAAAHQPCAEGIHAAAQIADAHGAGIGMAAHLVEGLHLHGADKGNQSVGQGLGHRRQKTNDKKQQDLAQQNDLPPVDPLIAFQPDVDALCKRRADQKGDDRYQVFDHGEPFTLEQGGAEQHNIAGLGMDIFLD